MCSANSSHTVHRRGRRRARRSGLATQPVLAYASYIGRIGALAMALGVGAAVAGLGGTAWADESSGATTDSDSNQNSAPADPAGSDATDASPTAPDPAGGDPASPRLDRPGLRLPRVIVRSSGDAHAGARHRTDAPAHGSASVRRPDARSAPEPDSTAAPDPAPAAESDSAPSPEVPGQRSPGASVGAPAELSARPDTTAPALDGADAAEPATSATSVRSRQEPLPITGEVRIPGQRPVRVSAVVVASDPVDSTVAKVSTSPAPQVIFSGLQQANTARTLEPAQQIGAAPALNSIGQVVLGLLGAIGINATNGPVPLAPLQPLLGALDLIRREIERFLFNASPALAYDPAENVVLPDGSIMGFLHPIEPDSTLTYTITDPGHGAVELKADGSFIYTPDPGTTGSDSFFVTVSDAGPHIHGLSGLLNLVTFGLLGDAGHTYTQGVTVGLDRTILASGLFWPSDFQFLPDGRILMANTYGAVTAYNNNNGQLQTEPLITLPGEEGNYPQVLGIAIDPAFEQNGYIYLAWVENVTPQKFNRVSRFTVTDPSAAVLTIDPQSEFILLVGDQPSDEGHHGGAIRFGPDGKLYVGLGNNDLHWANYQIGNNAQDLTNIYGKILRLNPDGTVPEDNPFVNTPNVNPYIYAYGFRNPFKMTFAPDGQLIVVDTGEATWEEVNNVIAGGNYGWPLAEGPCNGVGVTSCESPSSYENPIYAYLHSGGASAISGVAVFDGTTYGPLYQNKIFVADFSQGWIRAVTCTADYSSCTTDLVFATEVGPTVSLEVGPDGHIYQLTHVDPDNLSSLEPSGEIGRFT